MPMMKPVVGDAGPLVRPDPCIAHDGSHISVAAAGARLPRATRSTARKILI